ncbi:hypothetical protein M5K25_001777 [Dendrobium thyrsiflorum]|uniref:Uncharacterized protein n=1 Tax=Dendrobium thyrsiflorum TaxID=117978 RepID=A0ABD0W2F0_DENTH
MGCKQVKEFHYLGIKVALRRLVWNDFQFIVDKALRMINIWGFKVISLAGRITLVKTILLTYPIFHSTLSLVPKSILLDLEKLCRTFIWSKGNGKKGLHFVKWELLCKSKESGGRGIYSCSNNIGILRAKLAWRYSHDKESLLHKCLFPKFGKLYSSGGSLKSASSAWKLIEDGGKYLKLIFRWSIANGRDVSVFKDTWILDKCINKWPTFVKVDCIDDLKVKALISNKSWNIAVLDGFFGQELNDLISNIQIQSNFKEDEMELINIFSGSSCRQLLCGSAFFYFQNKSGIWDANQPRLFNRWHPTPPDWIKVNVDASLLPSYKAGVAGVFRDYRGRFLFAFGHRCVHWDISSLEIIAIKFLNDYLSDWMFKYEGIVIEGDNINVISSKCCHLTQGSSCTRHSGDDHFLTIIDESTYHRYKEPRITPSRMPNQFALNFQGQESEEPNSDEVRGAVPVSPPAPTPTPAPVASEPTPRPHYYPS